MGYICKLFNDVHDRRHASLHNHSTDNNKGRVEASAQRTYHHRPSPLNMAGVAWDEEYLDSPHCCMLLRLYYPIYSTHCDLSVQLQITMDIEHYNAPQVHETYMYVCIYSQCHEQQGLICTHPLEAEPLRHDHTEMQSAAWCLHDH